MLSNSIGKWLDSLPEGIVMAYTLLHLPAAGLAAAWNTLGLPPYGDRAFSLYPYSVVAQWMLAGTLIGLWVCRKS